MSDSDGDELGVSPQPPTDGGRGSFGISIGNVFDDTAGARKSVETQEQQLRMWNRFLEYLLTVRHALRAVRRAFLMEAYQLPPLTQLRLSQRSFLELYMSERERLLNLSKSGAEIVSLPGASTRYDDKFAVILLKAAKYSLNEAVQIILVRS